MLARVLDSNCAMSNGIGPWTRLIMLPRVHYDSTCNVRSAKDSTPNQASTWTRLHRAPATCVPIVKFEMGPSDDNRFLCRNSTELT